MTAPVPLRTLKGEGSSKLHLMPRPMDKRIRVVYACGPITGHAAKDSIDWRVQLETALSQATAGMNVLASSPMRWKHHLAANGEVVTKSHYTEKDVQDPRDLYFTSKEGIIGRDRFDTLRSHLIFCNMLPANGRISYGSVLEWGWSSAYGNPIILVMEDGNAHDQPFTRQLIAEGVIAGHKTTFEEAVAEALTALRYINWKDEVTLPRLNYGEENGSPLVVNLRDANGDMRQPTLEETFNMGVANATLRPIILVGDKAWVEKNLHGMILRIADWVLPNTVDTDTVSTAVSSPGI